MKQKNYIYRWLKEPIVWIVGVLIFCGLSYSRLPVWFVRSSLTVSILLKDLLLFFIPFLIFSGVASAFLALKGNGLRFILSLMSIIICSNFINLMLSGWIGYKWIPILTKTGQSIPVVDLEHSILPFFQVHLPNIFSNTWALVSGLIVGMMGTFFRTDNIQKVIGGLHRIVMKCMLKGFIPTLPFFLMGFVLKLLSEGQLAYFLQCNLKPCCLMVGVLWFYLGLWFIAACWCSKIPAIMLFKNIFTPILTGATTMSSAAALPFSIEAATKNTKDPTLANSVMSITLNFHMLGDTICIPILAVIILNSFVCSMPSCWTFMGFGFFFVLNKFAGAGIPSGTIMIALPILQSWLGFNEEMLALITACYMLIDPITTSGNVAANNLLIIFIKKIWDTLGQLKCSKK